MEYLLFLNKFSLDKEKLKTKLKALDSSAIFSDEDNILFVISKLTAYKFMHFQEVKGLVSVFSNWQVFGFREIKEVCLRLCKSNNIKNYFIETKFYDKVPISAKSLYKHINPYLKYEGINVSEGGEIIYLEFKKIDGKLNYRVCSSKHGLWHRENALKVDMSKFVIVIENPNLVSEVGDFLRLCWIFKLPLYVVTNNKADFERILKKAKEETKGIDYDKFDLKVSKDLPKDFVLVGFSKYAGKNEKDMKEVLLSNKKLAFVFGDDKYGLTQDTRDSLNHCFRLTSELKKPLRASQALSYVLGFYTAYKL